MEEVDSIIVRQLKEIDCVLDDDKTSLRELDAGEILSCVLRCLSLILPGGAQEVPATPASNANMAAKYNTATFLASKCKELGFRGDLGYQSFLYGSESDVRNVMLFLIEKLPKDQVTPTPGRIELTLSDRFAASPELSRVWLPPSDDVCDREEMCAVPVANILNAKSILVNRIAPNKRQYYDEFARIPFHDAYSVSQSYQHHSLLDVLSAKHAFKVLPIAAQLEKATSMQTQFSHTNSAMPVPLTEQPASRKAARDANAEEQHSERSPTVLELLEQDLEEKVRATDASRRAICNTNAALVDLETCLKEEQVKLLELKSRNLSLQELQEMEEKAQQDLQDLKRKWQEMKVELEHEIKELSASSSRLEEYQREISETKKQIRNKRKEIESKSETLDQLKSQIPSHMPPTRNSYTKRILEIINNIKKQDAETKKLITEMRSLQKEINLLTGKVSRCFSVADELIFSQAKTDDFSRRSYKLLASMHQESNKLSQLIEATGLLRREILKLEESVQKQTGLKIETKLAKISDDYKQLKQNNKQLMLQLEGADVEKK